MRRSGARSGVTISLATVLEHPGARIACALATAGLLTISFPPFDFGAAAWIALVPLAAACEAGAPAGAFGLGLMAGAAAALGTCGWIFNVPHFGVVQAAAGALYLGLYPAAWCAGLAIMQRSRVPFVPAGAALWVALDFLRAHAGFLAVPWATLAQSQHRDLALLQTASLTGATGITFAIVMMNLAIAAALTRNRWRPLAVAAGIVAALHIGGACAVSFAASGPTINIAAVQPAITRREVATNRGWNDALGRLTRLTGEAEHSSPKPALVVWPETAVRNLSNSRALMKRLKGMAARSRVPIILGSSDVHFSLGWSGPGFSVAPSYYNAAWMIPARGAVPKPYFKMILLPFAEYQPLAGWVRWPRWLAPRMFDTTGGHTRTLFRLGAGIRVAPVICWENLFADRVRRSVADGAQLIVHLVNDNWFGQSAEPRQHDLASVMRAVENRVPVVVASNTGPSEIIDPTGQVIAKGPGLFTSGFISTPVILGAGSPYTRYGDWFPWSCVAAASLAIGFALVRARRRPSHGYHLRTETAANRKNRHLLRQGEIS